jgi:hypothetical protein
MRYSTSLLRSLLALSLLVLSSALAVQAQQYQRARDDGRPEQDNISGYIDRPENAVFPQVTMNNGVDSENGHTSQEEDGQATSGQSGRTALSMDVYPNPATTFLQVNLNQEVEMVLSLTNLVGKEVYRFHGMARESRVDLQGFNPGVYFVTVQYGTERIVRKVRVTP